MSCCSGKCGCGSSCNGCGSMYPDVEASATVTFIVAAPTHKASAGGLEMTAEAENGGCGCGTCKCGTSCGCSCCTC